MRLLETTGVMFQRVGAAHPAVGAGLPVQSVGAKRRVTRPYWGACIFIQQPEATGKNAIAHQLLAAYNRPEADYSDLGQFAIGLPVEPC